MEDIKRNYEETISDTQKTALYGLIMIVPLGLLAWAIEHIKDSMKKTFKDFAEACWDTHKQVGFKMKGGKRVPNCVPKNEEDELNELGPAAMKRLARKRAYAAKTMAKYGQAAKMGIPASKVNQRRNTPTRTK